MFRQQLFLLPFMLIEMPKWSEVHSITGISIFLKSIIQLLGLYVIYWKGGYCEKS